MGRRARGWRPHHELTIGSTTLDVATWAEVCELRARHVCERLDRGWAPEDALATPSWDRHPSDGWPYELDLEAQRFVAAHPGGATLGEIGDYYGVSRERVRQIVERACGRLRRDGHADVLRRLVSRDTPSW